MREPSIDTLSELRSAMAEHDARYAQIALAAARLDTAGDWAADGSLTMGAWLRHHTRTADTDINTLLRLGRFLTRYQPFADASLDGRLSLGQVTAMRRAVRRDTEPVLDDHATAMVDILQPLELRDTVTACQTWKARAEAVIDPTPPKQELPSELTFAVDDNGQAIGRFTLTPAGTLEFEKAITNASTYGGETDTRTPAQRRADALEDIMAFFNANHDRSGTPRHRPHVELVVQSDGTVTTIDGRPVDQACAETLLCDCTLHRVLKVGSSILDYGRATRAVPYPTFRALALRDGGCRAGGCCRTVAWTDAHHIRYWRNGGPTNLRNLVLLCWRHHHLLHQHGWHLELLDDGTVIITTHTGHQLISQPRGSPPQLPLAA